MTVRACAVALAFATSLAAAANAGEKNMASATRLFEVAKELQGKAFSPALMQKLAGKMANFYTPDVQCQFNMGTSIQFTGAGMTECFSGYAVKFWFLKLDSYKVTSMAVAPNSGGKTVLVHMTTTMSGVNAAGQDVPRTARQVPSSWRMDFNDDGKIAAYDSESPPEVVEGIRNAVAAADSALQLSKPAASGATAVNVGEKNMASAARLFEDAKEMQGKALSPALVQKLAGKLANFYTPDVQCQSNMGTAIQFTGAGMTECFMGYAAKFWFLKLDSYKVTSMAVAPNSGGKTVLVHMTAIMSGVNAAGQDVPGTVRQVPNSWRMDFNDDGKIAAYDSESPPEVVEGIRNAVAAADSALQLFIPAASGAATAVFALGAITGGVVGGCVVFLKGRPAREVLLNGYVPV